MTEVHSIDGAQRSAARVAGVAYLLPFALIVYANYGLRGALMGGGDVGAKIQWMVANESTFRLSVAFDVAYCIGGIVLLAALYVVLARTGKYLSVLAAAMRFAYVVTGVLTALTFLHALHLVGNPAYARELGAAALSAALRQDLAARGDQYYVGLVFWSVAATLIAWLWLRSRYIPRGLAMFLVAASGWCVVCAVAYIAHPGFANVVNLWWFDSPMALGEIALGSWLLVKGLR